MSLGSALSSKIELRIRVILPLSQGISLPLPHSQKGFQGQEGIYRAGIGPLDFGLSWCVWFLIDSSLVLALFLSSWPLSAPRATFAPPLRTPSSGWGAQQLWVSFTTLSKSLTHGQLNVGAMLNEGILSEFAICLSNER